MQLSAISSILAGPRAAAARIDTPMDLIDLSEKGVTKAALLRLADFLRLSLSQIAQLLPIAERTVQRYSRGERFSPLVSEHILHIAEIAARGAEVFGDRDRFVSWMSHPSRALAQKTPTSLLRSRFGVRMVLDELGRIEHGVVS